MTARPKNSTEVAEAVREASRILAVAGRTKPILAKTSGAEHLDLSGLSGIMEYEPSEYVFTAKAGTLVSEVQRTLREHGQYLPFDPPFAEDGSTLGGMVAAGLNGPGRLRFGGLRDFLIGVTFVDGNGRLVKGGGKVVKNAAGFDLPKFLVGSLGRFGVLTELSFKVFPQPESYATLCFPHKDLTEGLEAVLRIAGSSWEPDALELKSSGEVVLRLGGTERALVERVEHNLKELGHLGERLEDEEASKFWREANAFGWAPQESSLTKVPLTPNQILELDDVLIYYEAARRYGSGCNVAWVAWPAEKPESALDAALRKIDLGGLVFRGNGERVSLGRWRSGAIKHAVKAAFDPKDKFPAIP